MSGFHVLWRIEIEKWSRENETGTGEKTKSDYAAKAVDSCGITPFGCFGGSDNLFLGKRKRLRGESDQGRPEIPEVSGIERCKSH